MDWPCFSWRRERRSVDPWLGAARPVGAENVLGRRTRSPVSEYAAAWASVPLRDRVLPGQRARRASRRALDAPGTNDEKGGSRQENRQRDSLNRGAHGEVLDDATDGGGDRPVERIVMLP